MRLRLIAALLLASLSSAFAADNNFPTPGNATAGLMVNGCLNSTGQAVPCGTAAFGTNNLATTQVSVGTTSTSVIAARSGRRAVTVTNITGTQPVYCQSGTASLTTGQYIGATAGSQFTFPYAGALNCIASTAAQTVSVTETY